MYSCVLIVPTQARQQANALASAMGWGDDSYTVALSDGGPNPTHWGLHVWVTQAFADMVEAAQNGEMPPELEGNFPPADFAEVLSYLIMSIKSTSNPSLHFNAVCAKNNMHRWIEG